MIGGYWTLPFLFAGIAFLLFRRKNKDLLLISYLIAFYIVVHQHIFFGIMRQERFMELEAQIVYPLIILGLFFLLSLLKIPKQLKKYIKPGAISLFLILFLLLHGKPVYTQLASAYPDILRINPDQYEAATWMMENLPENSTSYDIGTLVYSKRKWLRVLSQRYLNFSVKKEFDFTANLVDYDYLIVDYSDLWKLNAANEIQQLQIWEEQQTNNSLLLYNKGNIRVYSLENR